MDITHISIRWLSIGSAKGRLLGKAGLQKRNPEYSHTQMFLSASLMKMLASVFYVMSHANVALVCKRCDNCMADVSRQSNSPKLS